MTDNQPLNIRQIMNRVRHGAAGQAASGHEPDAFAAGEHEEPAAAVRTGFFQGPDLDVDKNTFDLEELLVFHDRSFVIHAYQALLKRDPDPDGLDYYLQALRSGRLNKVMMLAAFQSSEEGRQQNVKVRGLRWPAFCEKLRNRSVIGKAVDYLFSFFGLHRIRADLHGQGIELGRLFEETGLALARLEARIESRLDDKADRVQLEQKADLDEMDRYMRSVSHVLDMVCALHDPASPETLKDAVPPGVDAYSGPWTDDLYVAFEDAFRGPRESIRDRLGVYLPDVRRALDKADPSTAPGHLPPDCRVVDLGCGRGEFLGLLSENGIRAAGIDTNRIMVQQGRDNGLDVREQDLFAFLQSMPGESLCVLTAFQVLEHLTFPGQLQLIDQCRRILAPGGLLILETPNPQNILAGSVDFHRDPTHLKPMHPDTLLFLARARGFARARIGWPIQGEEGFSLRDAPGSHFADFSDYLDAARDYALLAYKA